MIRSELADAVGEEHTSVSAVDRLVYSTDWSWMPQMWLDRAQEPPAPDIIVHPGSPEEIARVLQIANTYRLPVIPWGGGSGTQGGAIPIYGGILVDVKRLNKILDISEHSLTVTTQAGVNSSILERALNERGLTLPNYAASANCATAGGYVAARGSGVISTKYGKVEDLVMSLQVVLADGTIIRTPPVPKHASGPNFLGLFIGSEGLYGIITEVTFQIERLPETRLFRGVLFSDIHNALEAGRRIMLARLQPTVLRLYDEASTASLVKRVLDLEMQGSFLNIIFDGWKDIAGLQMEHALAICRELDGKDLGEYPAEHWWHHRYDFYYPPLGLYLPKMYGTLETVTTFDHIEKVYYAKKSAIEDGFKEWEARYIAHFSHWFPWGAAMYDRFIIDRPPEDARAALALHNEIWNVALRTSLANGGVLNEHHGIGLKIGRMMREQYGSFFPTIEAIKRAFDPKGIMNPGKQGLSV
jgi:alkyldihydroxyacetonephosphate synthase